MSTKDGINTSLKIIGAFGFAGIVVVAPNAVQALNLITKKNKKSFDKSRVMTELKRQGLVMVTSDGKKTKLTLTPAGAHRLQKLSIDELKIPKPKKWDNKWRMVSFDIPVSESKTRSYFTAQLRTLGLVMLQKSMWVHPYECFRQVSKTADYYNVRRYCSFFELSSIDEKNLSKLKKHFNLK